MKKVSVCVLALLISGMSFGQLSYYFPEKGDYDISLPSPDLFLGYSIGDHHTRYDLMVEYLRLLAEKSDRAEFEIFGYTEELRPQVILTISSPENLSRLDEIRKAHLKLSDPFESEMPDLSSLPVVIQLGFNVHGNEASAGEASLLAAYYLTASLDDEMDEMLNNSIIFIEPVLNPDGRERFVSWVNQNKGYSLSADPSDREHTEPWPGGRTNHYWFDLNRDWLPLTQKESRNRMERFHLWRPNVITDHHEMGTNSTFFFEPTKKGSENPIVTPENYNKLNNLFARGYAEELSKVDHYYDSGNSFDNSYPGYGSSYADLHGGVAILFEQASTRGLMQETDMGYILRFRKGIKNQVTGALSTVRTASKNMEMLNDYMIRFHRDAVSEAERGTVKGYIFGDNHDRGKTLAYADLLKRHSIDFYKPASDISGASALFEKEYSFFVPTAQARYKMVQTMFETNSHFPDSIFYDATAWAMAYSYGIPFEQLSKTPEANTVTSEIASGDNPPPLSTYGYLFSWSDYYSPALLNRLMNKGVRVRSAWTPFSAETDKGEIHFCRGSVLIPVPYQDMTPEELYKIIEAAASETHIKIYSVESSVTLTGPWLGNGSFKALRVPEILLFTDDGVSSSGAGTTWHLLDAVMGIKTVKTAAGRFGRTDINRYNTIIMPSGSYTMFSEDDISRLKEWVRRGGNLIATGQAVQFLSTNEFVKLQYNKPEIKVPDGTDYSSSRLERGKHSIGGIFCSAGIDITHPLGFGYQDKQITVYRNHTTFVNPAERVENNVVLYTSDPVVSGYVSEENGKLLPGLLSTGSFSYGRGNITLFIDDPLFRGCWPGTSKMMLNAIFLGSGV